MTTAEVREPCKTDRLAISLHTGGMATGSAVGQIALNTDSPCRLRGSATVQALDARHHSLGQALGPVAVPPGLVLGVPAPPSEAPARPARVYAAILLEGHVRDDRTTGELCAAANLVTPAYWRLSLDGRTKTVRNYDPGSADTRPDFPSLSACRSDFGIIDVRAEPE
jgi:hypothetical protein